MEKDKQLINVRLDRVLWRKVKIQATTDGKTITEWLTEVLNKNVGGK